MYPLPAVKEEVLEAVSALPITNEFEPGAKEVTAGAVEPPEELPVDEDVPLIEAPLTSYTDTEPVTVAPKDAVIVSAPELPAAAYQMYE